MSLNLSSGDYQIFRNSFKKFLNIEVIPHYPQWEKDGIIPRKYGKKPEH